VGKICDFWPISRCISVTVQDRAYIGYYKSLIGSRTLALNWRPIQWPWTPK